MRNWLIDPSRRVIVEADQPPFASIPISIEYDNILIYYWNNETDDYFVIDGCATPIPGVALVVTDHDLNWLKANVDFGTKVLIGGLAMYQGDTIFRAI